MLLGHWQEMKALGQARGAVSALAELLPDEAERVRDGTRRARPDRRAAGRRRRARAAGRPRARRRRGRRRSRRARRVDDHRRVEARGPRSEGDDVTAGTVATDSAIRVRVTAVGEETALAGIQRLVAEAQTVALAHPGARRPGRRAPLLRRRRRPRSQPSSSGRSLGDVDFAVISAVAVLVISCPHALGLAIPLVISISTSLAAAQRHPRQGSPEPRAQCASSTSSCSTRRAR